MLRLLRRAATLAARCTTPLVIGALLVGAGIAIALLSIGTVRQAGTQLTLKVFEAPSDVLTVKQAFEQLEAQPGAMLEKRTGRSEAPYWVLTEPHRFIPVVPTVFHAASRHAVSIEAWVLDNDGAVVASGYAKRGGALVGMESSIAGFSIAIPNGVQDPRLLMRVASRGPAKISVELWTASSLHDETRRFNETGGVLFGSMLMIAAFSALMAVLSRTSAFLLFSAWIITSLRFASYGNGWDFAWLGLGEIETHQELAINLPLAVYAFLGVQLFRTIFKREVASLRAGFLVRATTITSGLLVVLALVLPHKQFLPVLWLAVGPSLLVLAGLTVQIIFRRGSAAALWYGASWLVLFVGSGLEVASAAGLFSARSFFLNSTTAAVFSSLLAAVSLGERIKSEREGRIRAQNATVRALGRHKETYDSMPIGLFSLRPSGEIALCNPAFRTMLSLSEGRNGFGSIDHLLGAGVSNLLGKSAESISTSGVEIQSAGIISKRWFYIEVIRSRDWIEGSIQDITVRKAAESQLRALVDHDHLTGLRNRRGLEVELESAVGRANGGSACAIAYVDIDRFKLINDLHGHAVGDALLQQAAQRLTAAVRASDVVARLADAFVVLFIDCPDYSVAGLSDRILAAISDTPFEIDGRGLSVTASVGVVALDPSMSSIDAVTAADRACAEAKLRGRNCVVRLTERDGQLQTHLEELRVVADLQRRMPTEKFFLVFQPIVALRTPSSSLNYEVLIRMRGEDGKVLPPGNFIGAAERNGLMSQIDRWVLRNTLEWLDSHPEHRDRLSFATINISGASLNDSRFVDDAFAMIAEHPLAMRKLCLEVTESVALHDLGSTRRFVDRLRTYGSKLALDDFGAGYTSFNYLKEIPADFIKIDGTFVKDINRNPANYAITRMIVELTHELGMRSIAEWAETIDTIASLCDLGVDYGQGYGLVRPITADAIAPANSCADLVPDPQVIALLEERARSLPLPQLRRTPQRDLG